MPGRSCSAAPAPKNASASGRLITSVRLLPREQWAVLIPDHHPGYISWETYEATTARLRANWRPPRGHGGGAAREGRALLQGLLRCGRCGRIMQTGYSGTTGTAPAMCAPAPSSCMPASTSASPSAGIRLEQVVLAELFKVLEPAALEATAKALAEAEGHYRQTLAVFELAVERARYEAEPGPPPVRRGRAGEPAGRPHPGARLGRHARRRPARRERPARPAGPPPGLADRARNSLGSPRPAPTSPRYSTRRATTIPERKQLLRAAICEVVVTIHADTRVADLKIIWQGGAATDLAMPMTKTGGR